MPGAEVGPIRGIELEPIVKAGATARATTATIAHEIRGWAAEQGRVLGPDWWAEVNRMRSIFVAQRNATERFARATPDTPFDSRFLEPALNMRAPELRDIQPRYLAEVRLDVLKANGEIETRYASIQGVLRPGLLVSDITDELAGAAEHLGERYGGTLDSFSLSTIMLF